MPFSRPSLSELVARIKVDFETALGVVGQLLRRSVANVLAKALAGSVHLLYGHQVWIAKQVFPDTADSENLRRWCSIWGITQIEAEFASGTATVTGTNGSVIPDGTILTRSDGKEYETDGDITISAGTGTLTLDALVAEEDGNCEVGTILNFSSPISGVNSNAVVVLLSGGADIETEDALRARLLTRIAQPPLGGTAEDYEAWALQVAGVTRSWAKPLYFGIGTVGLFFVRDNDSGSIFPDTGEVATVQSYIDALRPVPAALTVLAPSGDPINFNITLTPSTTDVKTAVQTELEDLIQREGEPGGTILLSHMREAISTAAGETDHILNSPVANHVSASGYLPTMGTITWS